MPCPARSTPSWSTPTPVALPALAAIPGVTSVTREPSYDITWPRDTPVASGSLAQAIRYFDLDRAADKGLDGTGVSAAVIDSGIDFTHANLGGPGTAGGLHRVLRHPARTRACPRPASPATLRRPATAPACSAPARRR